jgi:Methyltransferase domain
VEVKQGLLPRAIAKARRTIYPMLPASVVEYGRAARFVARSAAMTARGHRFGSDVQPVQVPPSSLHSDGEPNALRSYVEGHHEGRGIYKGRHYFDVYVRHLARFVGGEVVIVEVGVYSGGSVEMWKHYFGENATIHGVDIQEACRAYEGDGVHIHIGDQGDRAFWKRFKEDVPYIDVLIDDGGHHPNQMRVTFEELFPIMRPGGVYICEDIISNAFLAYLGGFAEHLMRYTKAPLAEPGVASGFLLPQAGVASAADSLQQAVRSIHLYPFVAVVERTLEPVTDFQFPMYGSEWQPF